MRAILDEAAVMLMAYLVFIGFTYLGAEVFKFQDEWAWMFGGAVTLMLIRVAYIAALRKAKRLGVSRC